MKRENEREGARERHDQPFRRVGWPVSFSIGAMNYACVLVLLEAQCDMQTTHTHTHLLILFIEKREYDDECR